MSFTEPNAPPADVRGHNTSSTSILVQWGEVPAVDQNGVILSYTVSYSVASENTPINKVVRVPTRNLTLTGLNEFTTYSIKVSASTSKGNGIANEPAIEVKTDEDSK